MLSTNNGNATPKDIFGEGLNPNEYATSILDFLTAFIIKRKKIPPRREPLTKRNGCGILYTIEKLPPGRKCSAFVGTSEHRVGHDQLRRRLPDLPSQSVVCAGIRGKRRRADGSVDHGDAGGYLLPVCGHLLCAVPRQRPVRLRELAQDGAAASKKMIMHFSFSVLTFPPF